MNRRRPVPISIPKEDSPSNVQLTNQGLVLPGDIEISSCGAVFDSPSKNSSSQARRTHDTDEHVGTPAQHCERVNSGATATTSSSSAVSGEACSYSLADLQELGVVGSGSGGVVKRVRHAPSGAVLVLKVIQFDAQSQQLSKNVATELRTLHGSRCPHIVTYHQSFLADGAISILMEYCDAGSLADLLKQVRRLPERYLAEVARQALAGLRHLHKELRVIHRDIKPSNLLLCSSGQLKITDFGVSGQLTSSVSQALSWVGTLTYMSPERIKGESYSFNSDVWSLGLMLLQCAIGRFPYTGEQGSTPGFWELLEQVVVEPAPQLPPGQFSSEFNDFVHACLQKDPAQRASVESLLQHPLLCKHSPANLADLLGPRAAQQGQQPRQAVAPAAKAAEGAAKAASPSPAAKASTWCSAAGPAAAKLQTSARPPSAASSGAGSGTPRSAASRYAPASNSTRAAAAPTSSTAAAAADRYSRASGPLTVHSPAVRTAVAAAGAGGCLSRPGVGPACSSSAPAKQLASLSLGAVVGAGTSAVGIRQSLGRPRSRGHSGSPSPYLAANRPVSGSGR